jgi:hypothetical protein
MKHSKLFLTGMAAALLSFGLMMTGCDSGGDSDNKTPAPPTVTVTDNTVTYKSTDGTTDTDTLVVLILEDATPEADDTFELYVGTVGGFKTDANFVGGAITGTPSDTSIVLRPDGNTDDTDDITVTLASGKVTAISGRGSSQTNFTVSGLTGGDVSDLAGTVALDKTSPTVGETVTATLTPAAGATDLVKYQWYKGDTGTTIDTKITDATNATYNVLQADKDKYLKVEVRVIGYHGIKAAATNAVTEGSAQQITDVTKDTGTVTQGDTALRVTASDGGFANNVKVYIKTADGAEVVITTAGTLSNYTAVDAGKVTQSSGKIVVMGLAAAAASATDGSKLKSGGAVSVVIKADAQSTQITAANVTATTGKPVTLAASTVTTTTDYTLVTGGTSGTIGSDGAFGFDAAGANPAAIKYYTNSAAVPLSGTTPLDADFDAKLITVLGALATGDKFVVTNNTTTFTSISFLNTTAPTVAKLQTALDNSASVTLGVDTTIGTDFTVPTGVTLTVGAGNTLAVAAGKTVTVPDTAIIKLAKTGIISLADNTSVINVGSTTATKFAVKGDSTGASTLTAGGTGSETVSLAGLAAGSKILGSANTATLTIGTKDAEIAIAAATNGLTLDAVTVDVSANGKITIAENGKVTLASSGGGIKTGGNSGSGGETNYATGSATGIAGASPNGCSILGGDSGNNNIDKNDTFASANSGVVTVTGT